MKKIIFLLSIYFLHVYVQFWYFLHAVVIIMMN